MRPERNFAKMREPTLRRILALAPFAPRNDFPLQRPHCHPRNHHHDGGLGLDHVKTAARPPASSSLPWLGARCSPHAEQRNRGASPLVVGPSHCCRCHGDLAAAVCSSTSSFEKACSGIGWSAAASETRRKTPTRTMIAPQELQSAAGETRTAKTKPSDDLRCHLTSVSFGCCCCSCSRSNLALAAAASWLALTEAGDDRGGSSHNPQVAVVLEETMRAQLRILCCCRCC